MLQPTFKLNTAFFSAALAQYIPTTKRDLADIVNQRTLNVAGRAFDRLPPRDVQAKRAEIKRYLQEPLSQRIRIAKSSGRVVKKGKKENQLQRMHLIVQARRAKRGLPGLYGRAMKRASGAFLQRAQVSVGFVKSILLPIITTLNPLVRFKFPFAKTRNISRWPGSAGFGRVQVAKAGEVSRAPFQIGANLKVPGEGKVRSLLAGALQQALYDEGREMIRHVREKMQATANRFNVRKAA